MMQYVDEKGKIFVGGLSWDTTHATMLKYFSRYGEVIDCVVMKNPATGKSRGFGFVTFKDPSCVETVLSSGPHCLDNRQIDPKACNPRSMNKGGKQSENSKKKIFIGGLPANATESQIKEFFGRYGQVSDVVIMYDQQKQRSRGFGFLTYESEESVDKVVQEHYVQLNGKQVECKRAEPRDLKLMADCAQLPGGLCQANALGLLAGSSLAAMTTPTLSTAGAAAMAAGYAIPQHIYPQGLRLVSPSPLVTLLGTVPAGCNQAAAMGYAPAGYPAAAAAAPGMDLSGALMSPTSSSTPSPYAPQVHTPTYSYSQAGTAAAAVLTNDAAAEKATYPALINHSFSPLAPGLPQRSPYPTAGGQDSGGYAPQDMHHPQQHMLPPQHPTMHFTHPTGNVQAQISFDPNVTYALASHAPHTLPPQPMHPSGGFGLSPSAASLMAGTYGQGDAPHTTFLTASPPTQLAYGRMTNHRALTQGYHPYRH